MQYHPFAVGQVSFSLDGLGGIMVVGMETLPAFHPAGKHNGVGRLSGDSQAEMYR